ncbi:uncharacterized protein LOC118645719 isoform X2 [Monomorium pharaonis]|nr:uncharacterized protein LOC118645719 isoform X2 [Monomorium pharaonis]
MCRYKNFDFYSKKCELAESQNFCFNKMKEAAKKAFVIGLLSEWEDVIYKLTNRSKGHDKYTDILKKHMQDAKDQYYETMHDMSIHQIIALKCEDVCNENLSTISLYEREREYSSRTVLATNFLRNRCAIAKQYYLSHRLIKNIVFKAHLLLPEIFCDFGHYRNLEFMDFDKFLASIEANLKKSAHIIITSYYNEIVQSFCQRRYIQDVPKNALTRFFKCATTLFGLQIVNRSIDTIKHLLNVLADQTAMPLLKAIP